MDSPDPLVVDPATVAPQPWRNGRGTTRELATGDGWRVSLADLTADGPFSHFPRTDRVFTPLGDGFGLVVDGVAVDVRRHQPIRFPGEAEVSVQGLTRPTQALNVMTDRGSRHGLVTLRAAAERPTSDVAVSVLLGEHVADICFLHHPPARERGATTSSPS